MAYVRQHVPVVLLESMRHLGKKGEIVHIKRGYARHFLVPKGLGVFATWENIDEYADPALMEDPTARAHKDGAELKRQPFDWVSEIRLQFVRWARDDHKMLLREPIGVWELLEELSSDHELDLLPSNLDLPEEAITSVGTHHVPVRIAFRNPESARGRYTIQVEVVSQQSLEDELRKEEMARQVKESMRFELPQRGGFDALEGEEEEDAEYGEIGPR